MTEPGLFAAAQEGNVLIITFRRNVSNYHDSELFADFQALLDTPHEPAVRHIVVDFGQMTYFGSGMLEAILLLWNRIHPLDGKLLLCNVSPVGREILDVSNFSTLWPICENRQAALQALRSA